MPARPLDGRAARLAAAELLSRRAWTRAELTLRLRRRGAPPEIADDVVADLVARGHVDDAAFARHWVESRAGRGLGPARLGAELRARGVEAALISAALANLTPEAQLARARQAAQERVRTLRATAPERAASRLRDHLLRRGFAGALVARVVRETLGVAVEE